MRSPRKFSEYGLDEWYYEDKWIRRKYNTDGWPTTLMAVNAVDICARQPAITPT